MHCGNSNGLPLVQKGQTQQKLLKLAKNYAIRLLQGSQNFCFLGSSKNVFAESATFESILVLGKKKKNERWTSGVGATLSEREKEMKVRKLTLELNA